jgi:cell division protein FtsL
MMRLLNIVVIVALVAAAAHVYKIKYDSTRQAEKLDKLRREIRLEHDAIATLRAQWSKLDNPERIQQLAQRHLHLKPIDPRQFDPLNNLAPRPPDLVPPGTNDPIGFLVENPEADLPTASLPEPKPKAKAQTNTKATSSVAKGGQKK